MKRLILFIYISIFSFSCENQNEQWLSKVPAAQVGFSPDFEQDLDSYIEQAVNDQVIPGGTFLVAKDGKVVYQNSFGKVGERLYSPSDIFRLASMTKALTNVSMMQLVESGKVSLDDPIYEYLPAYKNQVVLDDFNSNDSTYTTVPVKQPVTIRHLMTHTSGIVYGSFNPGKLMAVYEQFDMNVGFSHAEWSTEEWIDRLAEVPLAHQPGDRFSYGLNMDVMGRIIEVVSGQKLDEYFKEHIFDVVGMEDTYFYLPEEKFKRLTPVMMKVNGKYVNSDEIGMKALTDYPTRGPRDFFAGGAGLSGTIMDYTKFIQTLVEGGGDLLGPDALAEMTRDQMPEVINNYEQYPQGPDGSFALGFQLYQDKPSKKSPKSPGTYEWSGYFNTQFFIDPSEQMVFVGLTQINGFNQRSFWNEMYQMIYAGIEQ